MSCSTCPARVIRSASDSGLSEAQRHPVALADREVFFSICVAEGAGFVLDAKSEINANPDDRANYEGGVWTLPPSLRLGETDREKYLAIGESDRMTLRFRKP